MKLSAALLLSALGLPGSVSTRSSGTGVSNDEFAKFVEKNKVERKLNDDIPDVATNVTVETPEPTKNFASSNWYPKIKEKFCTHQGGDCDPAAVPETPEGSGRRLNQPPMPAYLLPEPHTGSAANFAYPCYPLDKEDGTWISIPPNDDMSYELILPFDFKLYGTIYPAGTSIWLNNNGNLSFDNAISSFTASDFPINSPMIAPFWSDVDTTTAGEVSFKFLPDNKLAVIWDQVGYYPERSNRLNTFQAIIGDGEDEVLGLGTNVCFCYVDMDWTTGGASGGEFGFGGSGATVGVNRGVNNDYIQIGMFNDTGMQYDGPGGDFDGVDFLDFKGSNLITNDNIFKKGICFEATGVNIPPIVTDFPQGNTATVPCGTTLNVSLTFASPELQQDTALSFSGVPDGMIVNAVTSPGGDVVTCNILWTPDHSTQSGTHNITFIATDNYDPPASRTEVLTVLVATCGTPYVPELPLMCANTTSSCTEDVGPYCTPNRSPEHCPADESFPLLVTNRRVQAFENPTMVEFEGFWFHILEDKVAQHAFTVSSGYPSPELYCCISETADLEDVCFGPGNTIPSGFTIRATGGHSGKGIYVLPYGFGGVDLISGHPKTLADIEMELGTNVDKILVEQFIDGSEFGSIPSLPTEFKFHMFDGTFGAIDVIYNKGTDCSCYLAVDTEWNRLDKYGCFVPQPAFGLDANDDQCFDIDFQYGADHPYKFKDQDLCGVVAPPEACMFENLKAVAKSLSEKLGVYMRIDMFVGGDGQVYVQEYTSNHAGGLRHCAAKETENGCIDSCFLGKLWKEKSDGTMYGGPQTPMPSILGDWRSNTDATQCSVAVGATSGSTFVLPCS